MSRDACSQPRVILVTRQPRGRAPERTISRAAMVRPHTGASYPGPESRWLIPNKPSKSFDYSMQVFNLSLAYAITFLASNVPYVTFELIIALDKQDNMGPIMAALFGNTYICTSKFIN